MATPIGELRDFQLAGDELRQQRVAQGGEGAGFTLSLSHDRDQQSLAPNDNRHGLVSSPWRSFDKRRAILLIVLVSPLTSAASIPILRPTIARVSPVFAT